MMLTVVWRPDSLGIRKVKPLSRRIQCSSWGLLGSGQKTVAGRWVFKRYFEVKLKDSGFEYSECEISLFYILFFSLFKKVRYRKAKMIRNNFFAITELWFSICWSHVLLCTTLLFIIFSNSLYLVPLQNGIFSPNPGSFSVPPKSPAYVYICHSALDYCDCSSWPHDLLPLQCRSFSQLCFNCL